MTSPVTLTRHAQVGVLTLNNPPVNALSHAVRVALLAQLKSAAADSELDALVIACAGRTFVAGADIREFGKPPLLPDLPDVVEFLDTIDKPLIAAIHGTALGGGLELSLACHYRVAASGARVGLPEVTLGLLPGAGGTQRLPRVVGVRVALDLIVRGTIIPATAARALGLVDEIVSGDLVEQAVIFARNVLAQRLALRRVSALAVSLDEPNAFDEYEQLAARIWRGFLAPVRCIAAVRAALELPFADGLRRERELFVELMASAQSRAQRHLFFGERELSRVPGLPETTPARPVKSAGVVGSGPLAQQIASCFAGAGIPTLVLAASSAESEGCFAQLHHDCAAAVATGKLERQQADQRLAAIRPALSYAELADVDLVIEAKSEDMTKKRELFRQLDAACKPGAVLATASSWSDLDELASATTRPADVIAMHFISPVDTARLLETARGPQSGLEACATVMKVGKSLGKVSVLATATPGLVAERLRARSAFEALCLLEAGASAEQIDWVLFDFGMPSGWEPSLKHAFANTASAPRNGGVRAEIEWLRDVGSAARWQRADVIDGMVSRALMREYSERTDAARPVSDQEVLERWLFCLINEGARILDEQIVARPLDVDMVCVHGLGFPVYRGGPLFYADELGLAAVHAGTSKYRDQVDAANWAPAASLDRLAAAGGRFYGGDAR